MKIFNMVLKLGVGVGILLFLLWKVGISEIIAAVSKINLLFLPLFILIIIFANLIGTYKISIFLHRKLIGFFRLYHCYFLSYCFSLFIPGRMGELALIYLLKKEGMSLGKTSAIVILDKLNGLISVFAIALMGSFIFFDFATSVLIFIYMASILLFVIVLIFSSLGRKFIRKFLLWKWEDKFAGFSKTLFKILREKKTLLMNNFLLSILKWVANALFLYAIFLSIGYGVSLVSIILINSIITLSSFIPITLNGLGVRESLGVFLFTLVGLPAAVSSSAFLVFLVVNYFLAGAYLMFFAKSEKLSGF